MKMSIESGPGPKRTLPAALAPSYRMLSHEASARPEAAHLPPSPISTLPKPVAPYAPQFRQRELAHVRVANKGEARALGISTGDYNSGSPAEKQAQSVQQEPPQEPALGAGVSLDPDWQPDLGIDAPGRAPILGDARIRNPVPNKLQHKLNDKDGNFAVMHMDVSKPVLDSRDLAAKRTSEMTQAAAIEATKNGYQPIKRSKLAWHPGQTSDQRLPDVLSPETAKFEQSRLLTLVRSLHPTLVVDQLCRALAYFGGTPGAALSAGSTFPDSDRMNGSGKAFVGWLAEIFPPMDLENLPQPSWVAVPAQHALVSGTQEVTDQVSQDATGPSPQGLENASAIGAANPQKRPRGRPKGSKGKKDKSLGKGERVVGHESAAGETEALSSQLSQPLPLSQSTVGAQISGVTHSGGVVPGSSPNVTPSGKKRGRPKGSKNRPKPQGTDDGGGKSVASPGPTNATAETVSNNPETPGINQSPHSQPQGFDQGDLITGGRLGMQAPPSQQVRDWAGQPSLDNLPPTQPTNPALEHSPARKRKPSMHLKQSSNPGTRLDFHTSDGYNPASASPTLQRNDRNMLQGGPEGAKRRRISKEASQSGVQATTNTHSNASPVETSSSTVTSPTTASSAGLMHNSPQGYDSQSPSLGPQASQHASLMHIRRGPWTQQQQQQYIQMQQQHQKRAHQVARNGAGLSLSEEAMSGIAHSAPTASFVSSSQDQQRTTARAQPKAQSHQMQQQKPGNGQSQGPSSLSHTIENGTGSYQTRPNSESQGFSQVSPSAPTLNGSAPNSSAMGLQPSTYPGFANNPAYLGMQYALGARRVVQPGASTYGAQLGGNQLEETLTQADMPNRMYSTFGRQS